MKKMRVIICIAISLVMVFTMTGMTASATEDMGNVDEGAAIAEETEGMELNDEADPEMDEFVLEYNGEAVKEGMQAPAYSVKSADPVMQTTSTQYPTYKGPQVKPVSGVKKIPGYGRVKVTWAAKKGFKNKKVNYKGKNGKVTETYVYETYRAENGKWVPKKTEKNGYAIKQGKKKRIQWVNHKNVKMYKKYKYKIVVVKHATFTPDDGSAAIKMTKKASKIVENAQCVRKMRIKIKTRMYKSLYSHDGKNKHITLSKGTKLWSDRAGGGYYYFRKNNALFRVSTVNAKPLKADYVKKKGNGYTKEQAEYFIRGYVSKNKVANKKYLIWVSTYHQRMYIFTKKKVSGKKLWTCVKSWDVSTGKMSTPSPTGKRKIHKKIRSRHGIPYWSPYSSLNALHGVQSGWAQYLGGIRSGGCIRNYNKNAKWIYNNCKIGTTVLVY